MRYNTFFLAGSKEITVSRKHTCVRMFVCCAVDFELRTYLTVPMKVSLGGFIILKVF